MHKIHLKGPWLYEWVETSVETEASDVIEQSGTVKMPGAWQQQFGELTGKVQLRRRFHWLAKLEVGQIVELVFNGVNGTGAVSVNEQPLGELSSSDQPTRFEITQLLQDANWLVVELEYQDSSNTAPGGLWAPVTLEITEPEPAGQ